MATKEEVQGFRTYLTGKGIDPANATPENATDYRSSPAPVAPPVQIKTDLTQKAQPVQPVIEPVQPVAPVEQPTQPTQITTDLTT